MLLSSGPNVDSFLWKNVAKKHLYNSSLGKIRWFVARFGAAELVLKPLRVAFAPLILPFLRSEKFVFQGRELDCFYHRYNMTWASERCVEVPVARHFLAAAAAEKTLEVGNVLSHYGPVAHEVLDKFEIAPGVINQDILEFRPAKRYELILSISTFEHIGFDDEGEGSSAQKILAAIAACRGMLAPGGRLIITVPMGYNPELNGLIAQERLGAERETFLRREGPRRWSECGREEALGCRYTAPFPYANGILVAEFGSK